MITSSIEHCAQRNQTQPQGTDAMASASRAPEKLEEAAPTEEPESTGEQMQVCAHIVLPHQAGMFCHRFSVW